MKNILPTFLLLFLLHHTNISRAQGAQRAQRAQGAQRVQAPKEDPQLQLTPATIRIIIDSLQQALKHNYVFPDTAAKMAAYLDQQYKKGAYATIRTN